MAITHPPSIINAYLQEKISQSFSTTVPFVPTMPTDIDALIQTFPSSNGMFSVYDRMFKYRRTPFPHIKSEQLLYYFYKTSDNAVELLFGATQKIHDLLDREDESAQELNAWISTKVVNDKIVINGTEFKPVFFHNLKVYQLEETRDVVDFGTARTFAGNKLIIDYDYHTVDYQ